MSANRADVAIVRWALAQERFGFELEAAGGDDRLTALVFAVVVAEREAELRQIHRGAAAQQRKILS